MKLGVKKHSVALCLNLLLQRPLTPELPFYPGRPPPRGRAFRGGPTGRSLQLVLCVGPHRPPVPSSNSQVCPVRGGPPDVRPPVPCGGAPCQTGPRMCTCGGQVQELLGAAPLPGQRVSGEGGGPTGCQGMEATLPTTQGVQGVSTSRERDPREPGDGEGGRGGSRGVAGGRGRGGDGGVGSRHDADGFPFPLIFLHLSPSLSFVWRYGGKEIEEPYWDRPFLSGTGCGHVREKPPLTFR